MYLILLLLCDKPIISMSWNLHELFTMQIKCLLMMNMLLILIEKLANNILNKFE